jgi:hypothetical protein
MSHKVFPVLRIFSSPALFPSRSLSNQELRPSDGMVRATCLADSEAGACLDGTLRASGQRTAFREINGADHADRRAPRHQIRALDSKRFAGLESERID